MQNNATGTNAVATGTNAVASGQRSVSLGYNSVIETNSAIAIGDSAKVGYAPTWQATTSYATGSIVKATASNDVFICNNGGTSGSAEPTWNTTAGSLINDGSTGVSWLWVDAAEFPACPDSISIGSNASSVATFAMALGAESVATYESIAIGYKAKCLGGYALALGSRPIAMGGIVWQ